MKNKVAAKIICNLKNIGFSYKATYFAIFFLLWLYPVSFSVEAV